MALVMKKISKRDKQKNKSEFPWFSSNKKKSENRVASGTAVRHDSPNRDSRQFLRNGRKVGIGSGVGRQSDETGAVSSLPVTGI